MLLRACFVQPTVDMTAGMERSTGDSGGLSTTSCVICFEEMEATTWLPRCAHGFHGGCVGIWFKKASTCPVCWHDKLWYLPPAYMAARNRILSESDPDESESDTDLGSDESESDTDLGSDESESD
ncbi:hypothetical protein HU200_014345 [Digitaria exilis]|uniref:RING-type E3 ubiquitin transferase n=1 Tax=Digitaria exilis TaxID=1010633 RepID=A0A835FCX1_9POAL|nr:hypothetical protein HU200_014345 [Digitaria exilis]